MTIVVFLLISMLESEIISIQQFVYLLVRTEGFALIQTLASAQESIQGQLVKHVSNINDYSSDNNIIFIAIWTWNLESQLLVHAYPDEVPLFLAISSLRSETTKINES